MTSALNLNRYRDKLHALRAHLDAQISQLADEAADAEDSADRASRQTDVAVNIGLATHEAVLRHEIDDALERMNVGTFAICGKCNAVIGTRRLNAIPYARYCVRCERRIEQEGTP